MNKCYENILLVFKKNRKIRLKLKKAQNNLDNLPHSQMDEVTSLIRDAMSTSVQHRCCFS
jgi:hypothetical protein